MDAPKNIRRVNQNQQQISENGLNFCRKTTLNKISLLLKCLCVCRRTKEYRTYRLSNMSRLLFYLHLLSAQSKVLYELFHFLLQIIVVSPHHHHAGGSWSQSQKTSLLHTPLLSGEVLTRQCRFTHMLTSFSATDRQSFSSAVKETSTNRNFKF